MRILAAFIITLLIGSSVYADEIDTIKFICNSPYTVEDVAIDGARADTDMIVGLTPLPTGCAWTHGNREGTIGRTVKIINVPGNRYARVSLVRLNGVTGWSAGIIDLIS